MDSRCGKRPGLVEKEMNEEENGLNYGDKAEQSWWYAHPNLDSADRDLDSWDILTEKMGRAAADVKVTIRASSRQLVGLSLDSVRIGR